MENAQGNDFFAPLRLCRGEDEEDTDRKIHESQNLDEHYGNEIISFIDTLPVLGSLDAEQFLDIEKQLSEYAVNINKFVNAWHYQDEAFNDYERSCKKSGKDTFGVRYTFDMAWRDESSPVPVFLTRYVRSFWGLLEANNVVLINVERNDIIGSYGFLQSSWTIKLLVDKIKTELALRHCVHDGIKEYVESYLSQTDSEIMDLSGKRCCDCRQSRALPLLCREFDFAKMRHKLTYASQFPMLMFWSIKKLKHSSDKDRIHDALKAIAKEAPYFPLMVTYNLKDVNPQYVTISEEDEDVRVMMSVFNDTIFTTLCDYKDDDSLTIEKFLVKLLMRDYHKYKRETIKYPRKRLALCPIEDLPSCAYGVAYEDEYISSKTNESPLTFQNSIDALHTWSTSSKVRKLTPQELEKFKVIDATNGLDQFVEEKFGKQWMWLNEEAENPDGSLFDVDAKTADIFFRFIYNIKQLDMMKFLVGVPLYLLQRFLRSSEHVREWLSQSTADREKACTLFCNSVNSLMSFGTLLAYYHVLNDSTGIHDKDNQRFTEQQMDTMKARLSERKIAEKIFVDYFFQPCQEVYSRISPYTVKSITASRFKDLLTQMNVFPYVFFLTFVKRYQFVTHEEYRETNQLHVLGLLFDALHSSPDDEARTIFRSERRHCNGSTFRSALYSIVTEGRNNAAKSPQKLCDFFHKEWEEISLPRFMEKVKLKTYQLGNLDTTSLMHRKIESGAQGVTTMVYASDIAVELVAKKFDRQSPYREVSGEIECLLRNQFNPHIVQVYGCILEGKKFSGILMEYCEGGSLHDYIKNTSSYTEKDILRWTSHASCGLLHLHENNIVHKDVKPKKMMRIDVDDRPSMHHVFNTFKKWDRAQHSEP